MPINVNERPRRGPPMPSSRSSGLRHQACPQRETCGRPRAEAMNFDMEFPRDAAQEDTPYEVLLHAAMLGQSVRFMRQDGVEETWRIMQPLLDVAAARPSLREGVLGTRRGGQDFRRKRPLVRAVDHIMRPKEEHQR